MPLLAPEEETELRNYLAAEGSSDAEAKALLARHAATITPNAVSTQPVARQFKSSAPASAERPNQARAQNQSPAEPAYPVQAKSGGTFGTGASLGGSVGGMLGAAGGIPGRMLGAGVGGALGDLAGQGASDPPRASAYTPDPDGALAQPAFPQKPDLSGAAMAGAGQAAITGGMGAVGKGLGAGAAKMGFPRLAALLGGTTPQAAQLGATPAAVKGMSTGTLGTIDATGAAGGPGAVNSVTNAMKFMADQDLKTGLAGQAARRAAPRIQTQLAQGAMDQAPRNAALAGAVGDALGSGGDQGTQSILKAVQSGAMKGSNSLPSGFGGPDPATLRQAFLRPNSFPQTAGSSSVAAARIPVAQGASQQGMLGTALGKSNDVLSDLTARGIQGTPVSQLATDAGGLQSMTNPTVMQKLGLRLPGKNAGDLIKQMIAGTGSGKQAMRQSAAVLGSRGLPSMNPQIAAQVSSNPAFATAQPTGTAALTALLAALSQNQSKKGR